MKMDQTFIEMFAGHVHQAFFYLIDECNLRCRQCLYTPELTFKMGGPQIPYSRAINLMRSIRDLGAIKMTFMGGEPTLYRELPQLIRETKRNGYEYVRIDTNGLFRETLLDNPSVRELDEITFSLDGPTPELNDKLRGDGVFERCVRNIRAAVRRGYKVQITTCIHRDLVRTIAPDDEMPLISMIRLAKELGASAINMHDLLKSGIPRDAFSGDFAPSVQEYVDAFGEVSRTFPLRDHEGFSIRMPQCAIRPQQFESNPEYFGYCSVKQRDRLLAFPNGMLRVCSLMIGSPYCVGYYDEERVYLNETPTNETRDHEMDCATPCTNQGKGNHFWPYVPLCVSYKPSQNEIVWATRHNWEARRITQIDAAAPFASPPVAI